MMHEPSVDDSLNKKVCPYRLEYYEFVISINLRTLKQVYQIQIYRESNICFEAYKFSMGSPLVKCVAGVQEGQTEIPFAVAVKQRFHLPSPVKQPNGKNPSPNTFRKESIDY
ncbi:hypothetical protein CEXT_503511 [Caerostris extrusa]|uniref:Uncharacterized protein n=1 Tax=Caerostris extrusa TaxID=172846 RepID=A0AAV4P1K9_CAEEX|nr:hypothetical protein CEXT_503511 [Caerostris extrusa]